MTQLFHWIQNLQHELLLFGAFWFLVGAVDDLCIDLLWFGHRMRSFLRRSGRQEDRVAPLDEHGSLMAIFVPRMGRGGGYRDDAAALPVRVERQPMPLSHLCGMLSQ